MRRTILYGVLLLFFVRCSHNREIEAPIEPHFNLTVDSIKVPSDYGRSFVVLGPPNVSENDLVCLELKEQVENSLLEAGFGKADRFSGADMVVQFSYEIADKKDQTITFGKAQRNGWISGATDEVVVNTLPFSVGLFEEKVGSVRRGEQGTRETEVNESTSTVVRIYKRRVVLNAFDVKDRNKAPGKRKNLWRTTIENEGPSEDWRVVFPNMIAGAVDFIGTDTRGQKNIQVFFREHSFYQRLLSISGRNRARNEASD